MRIRYYFLIGVVYLLSSLFGLYYITDAKYELNLDYVGGFNLTLPIPLWICMMIGVLFVISIAYMSLMALRYKLNEISEYRDYNKIVLQIKEQMLFLPPKSRMFGNSMFRELHKILSRFTLVPNLDTVECKNPKIDGLFRIFHSVRDGEIQDFRYIGMADNHPLNLVNLRNMSTDTVSNAYEVLETDIRHLDTLSSGTDIDGIYSNAWRKIIHSKNNKLLMKAIKLQNSRMPFEVLKDIIHYQAHNSLLSQDVVVNLIINAKLTQKQYLNLAVSLSGLFKEDNIQCLLSVFERLSKMDERSMFSYFYILLEVGKTDEAKDLKAQFPKEDYLSVSAFIALKDKGYPLLLFFDPLSYMDSKKGRVVDA